MAERHDTKRFMKTVRCGRGINNYKPFEKRSYSEGRTCDDDFIRMCGLREPFTNARCMTFVRLPRNIYPRHIQEFFAFYRFDSENLTLNFKMYNHEYTWTLEEFGNALNINSTGIKLYTDSTETREFLKYRIYHSSEANRINAATVQNVIFKPEYQCNNEADLQWAQSHLKDRIYAWEHVLTANAFVKLGARGNISIVVGYMLYCIETGTPFNFAYFMAKRMDKLHNNKRVIPYGRLLTTLFEHIKAEHPDHARDWPECEIVSPQNANFTGASLDRAHVDLELPQHAASTSQQPSMDPIGRMENLVNEMFDSRAWNASEEPISDDEEVSDVEALPAQERLAYKTYRASKRQRRESRTKFGVLKNFITRWASYMSCKGL